jgi:hypothetical protein
MKFSRLQPDSATTVGLLTAAGVYLIYNNALPNAADVRSAMPHNDDVDKLRRQAAFKSAALIGLVFLVARDLNSYIISGAALVGTDYMYKHANAIHPATGQMDTGGGGMTIAPGLAEAYPMPSYDDAEIA